MEKELLSILIVGDSHVAGYRPATYKVEAPDTGREITAMIQPASLGGAYVALDSIVTFPDSRIGLNPVMELALRKWPGLRLHGDPIDPVDRVSKHVALSLGTGLSAFDPAINVEDQAAERMLFRHDVDFLVPDRPELPLDPTCTLVPMMLIREMFMAILEPLRKALALVAKDYPGRCWLVGSPPPSDHNETKQKTFAARAQKHGMDQILLPSPAISLKVWILVKDCVDSLCKETGVTFIDCSPIACNSQGYLRADYEHDGVHGNAHYYDSLARHIVSIIGAAELDLRRR